MRLRVNEIEAYKRANGQFLKFVNHRSKLVKGALQRLIDFAKDNVEKKPIIYFSNGVRFLYKGIIINHNKKPSQPTLKRRFFQEKGGVFFMARFGKGVVLTLY